MNTSWLYFIDGKNKNADQFYHDFQTGVQSHN